MHSTDNLEDSYIGSGKRLWHSINKHGKENHVKEILEFLPDRKSLAEREKEIVNQEMLNEELCMNFALGGEGGFSSIEHELKFKESSKKNQGFKNTIHSKRNDKLFWEQYKKNVGLGLKKAFKDGNFIPYNWSGRKHTEETITKMQESKKGQGIGDKNSQYGKCWITNEIESKKIYKGDTIPEGWRLGRKIK